MLKIAWHPSFAHPLPAGHRFPMEKYELLPQQLLHEGLITQENFFSPHEIEEENILLTHCNLYWNKLKNQTLSRHEIRRIGFPLSKELITREKHICQGTIDAAHFALQFGIAMNISGGTHHAFSNAGEGFCLLNDQAVAANYLLKNNLAKKILIIDLDVHQGNGTAEIFRNNPAVFTFSMHGKNNFPLKKETSDLDIPLEDHLTDEAYLAILRQQLTSLFTNVKPDFVFYQCGVDVLKSDKLGKLHLTLAGCKERDRLVLNSCYQNNLPTVCSMGGGYSEKIAVIIEAHANTYRLAHEVFF